MNIPVHKAVEPDKLTVAGKKRFASLFDDLTSAVPERAIVQPKYDGVYAALVYDNKEGWTAWSRTGERLLSVGEPILRSFESQADVARMYVGELWVPGEAHQVINGRARKKSPQHLELKLFDAVQHEHLNPLGGETYGERQEYLWSHGLVEAVKDINLTGRIFVLDDLYDTAAALQARGSSAYDGLILRDRDGLFVPGKGTDGEIIKIKPRKEGDFRVVGTTRGVGNRSGGIGALVLDIGGGVTSEVGAGLTLKEIFEDADPTGRIATIEYLGITAAGKLREPSFKTYRFDKTEADVLDFTRKTED